MKTIRFFKKESARFFNFMTWFLLIILAISSITITSCEEEEEEEELIIDEPSGLVGQDGNPRFNLTFTNAANVDLDLYVKAPNGTIVYYGNPSGAGGVLDVDCLCGSCAQGPNENIFWQNGSAPNGQYQYWVKYFGGCSGSSGASSSFTLRVIKNGQILETKTGSLTSGQSATFVHNQS
jgi:hypothetical protein